MPITPTTHTFTDGVATSSEMNSYVRDPIAFLLSPPIAELRQTVAQSISNNVDTPLLFDTEDNDSANGHSTSVDTTRYTAVYPGWYELAGGVGFSANTTGIRTARWYVNGSALAAGVVYVLPITGGLSTVFTARTKKVYLNIGDYVELCILQTSGGALNTAVTSVEQSSMSIKAVSN